MVHANVWCSRPHDFGKGARSWYSINDSPDSILILHVCVYEPVLWAALPSLSLFSNQAREGEAVHHC